MRDTNAIMSLILEIAKNDTRIRAVFQTGSRVNPLAQRDIMQDYDIIYCVRDVRDFAEDKSFLNILGESLMIYEPDSMRTLGRNIGETYTYNCLFADGNKVDIVFYPIEKISTLITTETLLMLLMDKDNLIQQLPVSSDVGYRAPRPTKNEFEEAAQEFFYSAVNVVKYLYRRETIGAQYAYRGTIDMLNTLVSWYIANEKDYKVNLGVNYRYIDKNLDEEYRKLYYSCYLSMDETEGWQYLFSACTLYRKLGLTLADRLGYNYPKQMDVKINAYLRSLWGQTQKQRI